MKEERKQFQDNQACPSLEANETAAVHFQQWGDCDAVEPSNTTAKQPSLDSREEREDREGKRVDFNMVLVKTPSMSE